MNNDTEQNGNDFNVVYEDDMTLIEKLKELDVATTWQPIETAPTNGTKFDALHPKYGRLCNVQLNATFGLFLEHGYPIITTILKGYTHWKPISDANNHATIKAAITTLEKQARDIEIMRDAYQKLDNVGDFVSDKNMKQISSYDGKIVSINTEDIIILLNCAKILHEYFEKTGEDNE